MLGQRQRRLVGEVQRDPAVGAGQRGVAGPDHLAGGGQLVEVGRLVVAHPGAEHQRLERRGGHGAAGELVDRAEHAVDAAQPLPPTCCHAARNRPSDSGSTGSISWRSRASERRRSLRSTSASHHSVPEPDGPELAVEHPALGGEPLQGVADDGGAEPEPGGDVVGGERAVGAGVAGDQVGQRVVDGLGEDVGGAGRHGHAEPVAEPADVLDRRPPLVAGHPDLDDAPALGQGGEPAVGVGAVDASGRVDLGGRQRPEQAQQVGDALGVAGAAGRGRAAAARPRPRRAPRGRAARAARRGRAARRAGPGRGRARRPGARRWGSRPRT